MIIGRKLYIDWGDKCIAIEKYIKGEGENVTKENPTKLMNILSLDGISKMEVEVKPARTKLRYGLPIDFYLCDNSFWLTKEECIKREEEEDYYREDD